MFLLCSMLRASLLIINSVFGRCFEGGDDEAKAKVAQAAAAKCLHSELDMGFLLFSWHSEYNLMVLLCYLSVDIISNTLYCY